MPAAIPGGGSSRGTDGRLYGTASNGGADGAGTLYAVNPDGTGFALLYNFTGGNDGASPWARLLQGADGRLYGVANGGGPDNFGTVFAVNLDGSGFTTLYSFTDGNDGAYPATSLIQGTDGQLYGTASGGGPSGVGTVFSVSPTGLGFATIHNFTGGNDGANPNGVLIQRADGKLYGTATGGGLNGNGTAFAMNIDGTGFNTLYSFTGGNDGGSPDAGFIQKADGLLYGTATFGGVNSDGTVFAVSPAGTGFTALYGFTGGNDGANPYDALILGTDGRLYGTTNSGGGNGDGTVFAISNQNVFAGNNATLTVAATGDAPLSYQWQFNGANIAGATSATLTLTNVDASKAGSYTVVVTNPGGSVTGTAATLTVTIPPPPATPAFSPAAGTYTNVQLVTISSASVSPATAIYYTTDGSTPTTASTLYTGPISLSAITTLSAIGVNTGGSSPVTSGIYTIESVAVPAFSPAAGTYTGAQTVTMTSATSGATIRYTTDGSIPSETSGTVYTGPFIVNDTTLLRAIAYETGLVDSSLASGLYAIGSPAFALNDLVSFTGSNAFLFAGLVQGSDGNFYGTTQQGGTNSIGTVFRMTPAGVLTTLVSFTGANGSNPQTSLVLGSDGNFYGTTNYGGSAGDGTVFRMTPAGVLTTLVSFTGANGSSPQASLVLGSDGNFYGTTSYGGSAGDGTVFQMTPAGVLTTLVSFTGVNGTYPSASLEQGSDGNFYGSTQSGGSANDGTVFMITPAGVLTTLHSFNGSNGSNPRAALVQGSDGNFYGTTNGGGSNNDGTVFQMTPAGVLTTMVSFTGANGASPDGSLIQGSDGNFYGTTFSGGSGGYGTVFSITPEAVLTTLASFNYSNGAYLEAGLVRGSDGNLYGTTFEGGSTGYGVVFQVMVPPPLVLPPVFSQVPGTFSTGNPLSVTISDASPGATIYYTTDGTTPTVASTQYTTTLSLPLGTTTLSAIAVNVNGTSTVSAGTYLVTPAAPAFSPAAGTYTSAQTVTITTATPGASIAYTTDGSTPAEVGGTVTHGNLLSSGGSASIVGPTTTLNAIAFQNGLPDSLVTSGAYTINLPPDAAPVFSPAAGTYSGGQFVTISSTTPGAKLRYTIDGSTPTQTSGTIYSGPVTIGKTTLLKAVAYQNSFPTSTSPATVGLYTIGSPAVILNSLVSFTGANGNSSEAGLVQGSDGNFYGTTYSGGSNGDGTVFQMTPAGVLTTLVSFTGANGANPYAGLVQGSDGNFYGTTYSGGSNGDGTVFQMTPAGVLTTLVSFTGANGANPYASLVQGSDGNFYGTTYSGGSNGDGTVFQMTPAGVMTTLVSFTGANGANSYAGLVQGSDGNFYGTTFSGGSSYVSGSNSGYGTVFQMTPAGVLTTLVSFNSSNGANPYAGLVQGSDGNFYGTTYDGGSSNYGTVFQMTPAGALTTLVTFNSSNGAYPYGSLVQGDDGNFYGTTVQGGSNGYGTVFRITPEAVLTTVVSFDSSNGAYPYGTLLQGSDGNLYGTTYRGGLSNAGEVFQVMVPPTAVLAPVFSQVPGTFGTGNPLSVTISDASPGATIYYTTDGTTPTTASTQYTGILSLPLGTTTLSAIAVNVNGSSTVTAGTYLVTSATPVFSPVAGTYTSIPAVTITSAPPGVSIHYTTNGSTPSASSGTLYTGPVTFTQSPATLKAVAYQSGIPTSPVTSGVYTLNLPPAAAPVFTPAAGAYTSAQTVTITSATPGTTFRYTTDGSMPTETNGTLYSSPINVSGTTMLKAIAYQSGFPSSDSPVTSGLFTTTSSPTVSFNVVAEFPPGGYPPSGPIVQGSDGNFYGTSNDSCSSNGTAFRLTPGGVLTTLVLFGNGNGESPDGLIQGSDGNLYGTTGSGGANGRGTVYVMTPAGVLTTLASFNGTNGQDPNVLVQGSDGNFYGTTYSGGSAGDGTVFQMTPAGVLTSLFSFGGANGNHPQAGLIQGGDGNFYGTTYSGGSSNLGTVFMITPTGVLTTLASFGGPNGSNPEAALVQGNDGNFYGTTAYGGSSYVLAGNQGYGTVFQLTPAGVLTTLFSFNDTNGNNPNSLVQGTDGNFYGTTAYGGGRSEGTVFMITPEGAVTTLVTFNGQNGAYPTGLTKGSDGSLYGKTSQGGSRYQNGVIFQVIVPPAAVIAPEFSPIPGTYSTGNALSVTISEVTTGATIYYTTDGSTPTAASTPYTGTLSLSLGTTTLNAIAITATASSAVTSATYALTPAIPVFSTSSGTFTSFQSVAITSVTSGASIAYTTDGSTPTAAGGTVTHGTLLSNGGSVSVVTHTATLTAIAFESGLASSLATSATYTINLPPSAAPVFSPPAGVYAGAQTVAITSTTPGASFAYTTDGSTPTQSNGSVSHGTLYSGPINIGTTNELKAIAYVPGFATSGSPVTSGLYSITNSPADSFNVLCDFNASNGGGTSPNGLVQGSDGNFYGTTQSGGSNGRGTVFQLTPAGVLTTLVSFNSSNGANPYAGLVQGSDGNFYGMTQNAGSANDGTAFRMTPAGVLTTLLSFNGSNGRLPTAALVQGTDGNFYGTTPSGGTANQGTVFVMTPTGALTTLVSFSGANGAAPFTALVQGSDGNFYGTTYNGGSSGNNGTVFVMTPAGALTTLASFNGANGANPSGLVQGSDGNFYGTTQNGGSVNDGIVFKMTPSGVLTTLVSFNNSNGRRPNGLVQGSDGNFYGTTYYGGNSGVGLVFEITPTGVLTTLFSFNGANGSSPQANLVQGSDGNFYGTTSAGGAFNSGTFFEVILPPAVIAAPVFNPAPGTFANATSPLSVTLSDTSSGTTMYYTTDGTAPTAASTKYAGPLSVPVGTTTINAIAFTATGSSTISSGTYVLTPPPPSAPVFSPAGGTSYAGIQSVTITSAGSTAIHYTTDGTTPTTSSPSYFGSVSIASNTLLQAIGVNSGGASPVASATYTILPSAPAFNPAPGTYNSVASLPVSISDTISDALIYYTTDGSTPSTSSIPYTAAVSLPVGTTTLSAIGIDGNGSSPVTTGTYVVTPPPPVFSPAPGLYGSSTAVTLSPVPAGAAIHYTTDGSTPTTNSAAYTGPITVSATTHLEAVDYINGQTGGVADGLFNIGLLPSPSTPTSGFTGTYYQTANFSGTSFIRLDPVINFPANGNSIPTGTASAFWTATLTAQFNDSYTFYVLSDGNPQLWVGNTLVIDGSSQAGNQKLSGTISLVQGQTYPVRLQYVVRNPANAPQEQLVLTWSSAANFAEEPIPAWQVASGLAYASNVSVPAASPAGGAQIDGTSVSLSTTTPANANIYYTLDGTTPTTSSALYTTAIVLHSDTTIKAIGTATGFNNSGVLVTSYTIDRTPPTLSNLTFTPNSNGTPVPVPTTGTFNITSDGTLSVDAAASDVGIAYVQFQLDGNTLAYDTGALSSYTAPISLAALADGNHTLTVQAWDRLNLASAVTTVAINTALQPAAPPVFTSPTSGTKVGIASVTLRGTAEPNSLVTIYSGSTAFNPDHAAADGTFAIGVPLVLGPNQFTATAQNRNPTPSAPSSPVTVVYDDSVPNPPTALNAVAGSNGTIRLAWHGSGRRQ